MTYHDDHNSDDNENDNQPFGFNMDPEALSAMMNNIMSTSMGFGDNLNALAQGPMGIAERVAADIASRDVENESDEQNTEDAQQDPMTEIMGIMSMLATPSQAPRALRVDQDFVQRCEQIYPAAQNYVTQHTGSEEVSSLPLHITDRITWTRDYLSSMKRPLEAASHSLSPTLGSEPDLEESSQPMGFDIQSLLSQTVAPMMFGVQAGTMLGYLSHRAYGDDDVLLPTQLPTRVGMIASAVQRFAREWSVPVDESILYFLILQTVRAHIRSRGWLNKRLDDLCTRYVAAYELNPYKLEELLGDMNVNDPESVTAINVTPEQMFSTLRTPTHDVLDEEIGRISSLHDAYVEWVVHKELESLLPNYRIIQEARRRITVTTSDADRFVEQLFGVEISRAEREGASTFLNGILEREGEKYLHALWYNEEMIPTENEFDAPGLWIARLEMMDL